MSRENFLWGAPRIHGELLKLGFDVSQATVSRYMPRRSPLPSQGWRSFLRNQATGVGIISFGEAGELSDQLRSFVSGWIERIVRYATKLRDGHSSALTAPQGTLQPCSSHSANRNRHAIADTCIPINPRSAPSRGAHWMMTDRRSSPYRSRASPRHAGRRRDHPAVQRGALASAQRDHPAVQCACVSATDLVRAYFGTHVDKRATPDGSRRKTTLRRQASADPNAWIKF
jgi:hypothetical protein